MKKPARRTAKRPAKRPPAPRKRTSAAPRSRPVKVKAKVKEKEKEAAPSPAPVLSARELRELRARAHALNPLVQVGHGGVSEALLLAVSRALADHELIKVRLHEPEDKHGMAEEIATGTRSALCGLVGHTVILYRPKPKPKRTMYSR